MLTINHKITIAENEIQMDFVRSSGPGGAKRQQGQHRCPTAVRTPPIPRPLPEDVRERLFRLAGNRITREGLLVIDARRHRTQERNRQDALDRLAELIRQAAQAAPSFAARPSRPGKPDADEMEAKRQLSLKKRTRQTPVRADD